MEIDVKEKTAHNASVGADAGQSIQKDSDNSIPASEAKRNREMDDLEEMYRRMQRMADPRHLHTLTMTELFQTSYKSRPPIIENLLHSGAYLLAGAPKIGKSFLVAQVAYHVSTGQDLWGCKVHQGTVLYLALEDDFQRIQNRMFMMYGVNDTPNLHFATAAGKSGTVWTSSWGISCENIRTPNSLSLTPCRKSGRWEARHTATPVTMRSLVNSSSLQISIVSAC